ncbi:MAG: caspase family protein, partial [Thiomargarita sp.]|nr:caspase family protein [Thiomargarita sp.]
MKYFITATISLLVMLVILMVFLLYQQTTLPPIVVDVQNKGGGGVVSVTPKQIADPVISKVGTSILDSYTASHALLIGESDYKYWQDLESIPRELKTVESVLKQQGFTVDMVFDLTASALKAKYEWFINEYGYDKDNRLLFFYSGHGYTRDGKGYLVPIDAPNPHKNVKSFLQKSLRMTDILAMARRIEAKHVLFLFDSCFSGSVFKAKEGLSIPAQITAMADLPVRQFITAGSANEVVPAKSVFTPAFVNALLYGVGDLTGDGYITGQELGFYLQGKVPQYTQQIPQYGKIRDIELSEGDFIFSVVSKSEPVIVKSDEMIHLE